MNYKAKLTSPNPVAIRKGQTETHAPDHDHVWKPVTCTVCQAEFFIGPNRIYGSSSTEGECAAELQALLADDHQHDRTHHDSSNLRG